jgi:hypothetical protein
MCKSKSKSGVKSKPQTLQGTMVTPEADCFVLFIEVSYQKAVEWNLSFNFLCVSSENMSMKICAWNIRRELIDPRSFPEDVIYWVL